MMKVSKRRSATRHLAQDGLEQEGPNGSKQRRAAEYVRMSTDHQRYSVDNQSALIRSFAESHGMTIVETYADLGKSGLTIRDRPGLSRLLADVVAGKATFEAVLVYDVSRWGRFQDGDESAHYEFLCRRAGVQVIYCAEHFSSDPSPFAGVMKSLKRAMAGEFSREMGVKIAAGKARIGGMGFRVGGWAGFGLRRQILEDGTKPGIVLRGHQRKSIQTDRVILIPGPQDEINLVRRIYRDYIHLRKSERQIADNLNAEGLRCFDRPWSRALVRTILSNEKYVGNNVVGKFSQRLRTPTVINPPEKWVRRYGAFEPIIASEVFQAAAVVRRWNEKTYFSREALLDMLKTLLKREGKLTTALINRAPDMPSANTVILRFGSLGQAYEEVGYKPPRQYAHHAVDRALGGVAIELASELLQCLSTMGVECRRGATGLIVLRSHDTAEIVCCRRQGQRNAKQGWRIAYRRSLGASMLIAVRFHEAGGVRDLLVVPRSVLTTLPKFLRAHDDLLIAPYRCYDMQSAAKALAAVTS